MIQHIESSYFFYSIFLTIYCKIQYYYDSNNQRIKVQPKYRTGL